MKTHHLPDEQRNFFGELLNILTNREIALLKARAQKAANRRLAEILGDELIERNMIAKAKAK
jgi:hypothetical protein